MCITISSINLQFNALHHSMGPVRHSRKMGADWRHLQLQRTSQGGAAPLYSTELAVTKQHTKPTNNSKPMLPHQQPQNRLCRAAASNRTPPLPVLALTFYRPHLNDVLFLAHATHTTLENPEPAALQRHSRHPPPSLRCHTFPETCACNVCT